jgi:hypothetical protein
MKQLKFVFGAMICFYSIYSLTGCQKLSYHTINKAAYLRVFNDLNYALTLDNKDAPLPFLTMLIDPVIDSKGVITGAAIMGDHLDMRSSYAPAYPAHAGNSGFRNPEYPGQENVLVGPILNGIDLSSWAQVPSGKHRIMFVSRPVTADAFLSLDPSNRNKILVDTTINLNEGQVYTMETINADAYSNKVSLYLRNEQFTNTAFSDSSVYVNFYNLGSKGYWQKNYGVIDVGSGQQVPEVKDTMNIYLSLLKGSSSNPYPSPAFDSAAVGYNSIYFARVIRSTASDVHPYYSFPLFPTVGSNHISTNIYQVFDLFAPGYDNNRVGPGTNPVSYPNYAGIICFGYDYTQGQTPNLIVTTPSGQYNPRSFGTINTIEIVNGKTYLMTVQRKYDPPVIH